jgi:hypothetical protein
MKTPIIAAIVAVVTVTAQSTDPMAGTWKLNVAKSHYSPGPAPKGQTTTFEVIPVGMKAVSTTEGADGRTTRVTTTFQFDGKEYELKGAAVRMFRTYKRTGERRFEWTNREDGKITTTSVTEVSADGKTRTLTTTGHDRQGREVHTVAMYDRE